MRAEAKVWFEVGVKYEATQENGRQAWRRETMTVNAASFGDAEDQGVHHFMAQCSGELDVTSVARAAYREVMFSDKEDEDKWFKAKLAFITLDEKTGKERKTTATYLVQGKDIPTAVRNVDEVMAPTMIDYYIVSLNETGIVEVLEGVKN